MKPDMDVVILGASGYGGGELLRLLAGHPRLRSCLLYTSPSPRD